MRRRLDWPERMNEALDAARTREFGSKYACVVFAADVVLAMTNEDPLTPEERLADVAEFYARMRREFGSLVAAVDARFQKRVPVAFAQRGDLILRDGGEDDQALGICVGQHSAFIGDNGLVPVPTLECAAAWRVGGR